MKIEVKNVKFAAFASEETLCFEASLYANGKLFAIAKNDGHGGCDDHMIKDRELWNEVQAHVASLPEIECEWGSFPNNLDIIVADLVQDELSRKELKKHARKGVCFTEDDGRSVSRYPHMKGVKVSEGFYKSSLHMLQDRVEIPENAKWIDWDGSVIDDIAAWSSDFDSARRA